MKRPARAAYSAQDEAAIKSMKADGKSFEEIAKHLGRNAKAVQSKLWSMEHSASKETHKNSLKIPKPQAPRPMIALIGPPNEVTATIRELFS